MTDPENRSDETTSADRAAVPASTEAREDPTTGEAAESIGGLVVGLDEGSADRITARQGAAADAEAEADADRQADPTTSAVSALLQPDEFEMREPSEPAAAVDPADLSRAIEAILFVVEAPVTVTSLAAAIQQPVEAVAAAVDQIRRDYDERNAGIEVRDVAGGVRIYTRPAFADQVEKFLQDGQRSRLTQAALETLAVIAYRQPVTRSRVSAIRGVNVDGVVRTLTTRGLIVEVGTDPETGGGLYRTTDLFLEKMGLQSLEHLPSLAPLLPDLDGMETDEL